MWRFELQVIGLRSALGVHSERSIQGFCWGAPGAQHSSAPCLRPTTCSPCPGDTSRCVPEEKWHFVCVCVDTVYLRLSTVAGEMSQISHIDLSAVFRSHTRMCLIRSEWFCHRAAARRSRAPRKTGTFCFPGKMQHKHYDTVFCVSCPAYCLLKC